MIVYLTHRHAGQALSSSESICTQYVCRRIVISSFPTLQWLLEPLSSALQYKRRKGNSEVFVSATVQRFTELVHKKQHPVLDRLHELASHLLTHRRSARFTARQALEEVKMLAAMKAPSHQE